MILRPARYRLWVLMLAVAAAALVIWGVEMRGRSRHYRTQAEYQARLEARRRREAEKSREFLSDGSSSDREADSHAALRRRYERLAARPWETAPPGLLMPYPWDRDRDRDALEMVLADLLDPMNPEGVNFRAPRAGIAPQIVLSDASEQWYKVSAPDEEDRAWGLTDELWQDLQRRNAGGPFSIGELKLRRGDIHFGDIETLLDEATDRDLVLLDYLEKRYPGVVNVLTASLPGYSRDGTRAVVVIFGYTFEGSYGWIYLLTRSRAEWAISEKRFVP
jgi:hypothetical protein